MCVRALGSLLDRHTSSDQVNVNNDIGITPIVEVINLWGQGETERKKWRSKFVQNVEAEE